MILLRVTPIPAFDDNYLWLISNDKGEASIVDPGDPDVVLKALKQQELSLSAILITHHHSDHIGGVERLVGITGATVYGPAGEDIPCISHKLLNNNKINILGDMCEVIYTPGHTLGHIAYYFPNQAALFCGDTLFVAGCGRLFEGTAAQMFDSLTRLAALPPQTKIYCAHEYTLSNLRFAKTVEPDNQAINDKITRCQQMRHDGLATVPSTIKEELATNPFLRSHEPSVIQAAQRRVDRNTLSAVDVFTIIREWKDNFR